MKYFITTILFFLSIHILPAQCLLDSVCINAILADPNSSTNNFDTDDDGIADDLDEFVEICNKSISDVDISGWSIGDNDGNFPVMKFGDPTILPSDSCFMIISNWKNTATPPPSGVFDMDLNAPWINNDGDIISLVKNSMEICQVAFGVEDCTEIINPNIVFCDEWDDPTDGCPLVLGINECLFYPTSLPVDYLYFNADIIGSQVQLSWATSVEINNDYFIVEWSANGTGFEALAKIKGQVDSYEKQEYGFVHRNPVNGENYYRLKQVDLDGGYEYSKVEIEHLRNFDDIKLYQIDNLNSLWIEADKNLKYSLNVYDLTGKIIQRFSSQFGSGQIDLNNFQAGIYIARISGQGIDKSVKIFLN